MRSALASAVDELVASQAEAWPLLRQGLAGLSECRTRTLRFSRSEIQLRHIPHRMRSTTAPVDAASVAKRPCFLCAANLPPEEKGIAMDADFTAYTNPFPILEGHLTIVHRDHRPQGISGFVERALTFAADLPGRFVVYNGPACGASAPDHLHFQACSRAIFPIGDAASGTKGALDSGDGRRLFVLRGGDAAEMTGRVERLVTILAELTRASSEPLLNLAVLHEADEWTVFVFPRRRHRPRVFETGELTVSPAAIDMSGVFVVPKPEDFERIGAGDVAAIYDEVSIAPDLFAEAERRLEGGS